MRARLPFLRPAATAFALVLTLLPALAFAASGAPPAGAPEADVCRRLHAAGLDHRRCDPDQTRIDPAAYCRRVWGTDAWTRRCLQLGDFDPAAYCRRIWGTDLWTRRCLHLNDDDRRPPADPAAEPVRPASDPVRPAGEPAQPLDVTVAEPSSPAEVVSRPTRVEQPARSSR
jgi:hypothetical protein